MIAERNGMKAFQFTRTSEPNRLLGRLRAPLDSMSFFDQHVHEAGLSIPNLNDEKEENEEKDEEGK